MTVPPRAVLFDVGMTLVHPDGAILAEELLAEGIAGVSPDDAVAALQMSCAAAHMRLPAGHDVFERTGLAMSAALATRPDGTIAALTRSLTARDLYRLLDPGAAGMLAGLRSLGVRTAVVSNSDGTLLTELERFGLREAFEVVVDSTVAGVEKPSPEIFQTALDQLGLPAGQCWYVGDDVVNDVIGGMAAGFGTVVLYDRFGLYRHIPGVVRIEDLAALPALAGSALTTR